MTQPVLLILILLLLIATAFALVLFFQKTFSDPSRESNDGFEESKGAHRGIFHHLWLLLIWTILSIAAPMFYSIRAEINFSGADGRVGSFLRSAFLFAIVLWVLLFQRKETFFRWIDRLSWPKKDYE